MTEKEFNEKYTDMFSFYEETFKGVSKELSLWSKAIKRIGQILVSPILFLEDLLDRQVYVYPELHKQIEGRLLELPSEQITIIKGSGSNKTVTIKDIVQKEDNSNTFYILSHVSEESSKGEILYRTNREVGMWVKTIVDTYRNNQSQLQEKEQEIRKLKGKIINVPYDKKTSELVIGEVTIPFIETEDTHIICSMIFGNINKLQTEWAIDDFVDEIEKIREHENPSDWVGAIKSKIYRINYRVESATKGKVKNLLKCKASKVFINPKYLYLFKE
jgi:hypothetical protein